MAGQHLPEHHAKRVQVRTDVHANPANCSGLANSGVPAKAPGVEIAASAGRVGCWLRQPKVNDFGCYSASLLDIHHDVAWFDVPVNELLLVHRSQTGGDLRRDFERQLYLEPARSV